MDGPKNFHKISLIQISVLPFRFPIFCLQKNNTVEQYIHGDSKNLSWFLSKNKESRNCILRFKAIFGGTCHSKPVMLKNISNIFDYLKAFEMKEFAKPLFLQKPSSNCIHWHVHWIKVQKKRWFYKSLFHNFNARYSENYGRSRTKRWVR